MTCGLKLPALDRMMPESFSEQQANFLLSKMLFLQKTAPSFYDQARSLELHRQDRSAIYGMFHLYTKTEGTAAST